MLNNSALGSASINTLGTKGISFRTLLGYLDKIR
jgi:hypothetical protein